MPLLLLGLFVLGLLGSGVFCFCVAQHRRAARQAMDTREHELRQAREERRRMEAEARAREAAHATALLSRG